MIGSGARHVPLDPVGQVARPANSASSSVFSSTEPTTSPAVTGGSAAHHGQLADAVLAQDVDRLADGLVRVGVHQRSASRRTSRRSSSPTVSPPADVEEAVVGHPLVAEDLVEVAAAAVGQQHDDDVVLGQLLGGAQRGDDGHPARAADQQPLLAGQPPGHREGVAVGDRR